MMGVIPPSSGGGIYAVKRQLYLDELSIGGFELLLGGASVFRAHVSTNFVMSWGCLVTGLPEPLGLIILMECRLSDKEVPVLLCSAAKTVFHLKMKFSDTELSTCLPSSQIL